VLAGTIRTPGPRTVAAALRVLGLAHAPACQHYHRVLNRATWASRALSQILLLLLLRACVPDAAPVVVGSDEPSARRRGAKIAPNGIERDPVRSRTAHVVKTSGLRWVSLQVLAPIPWIGRGWALPVLTVLAPAARYHVPRGQRHTQVHAWGRHLIDQLRRWLPDRTLVVVAESTDAVLEWRAAGGRWAGPVTLIPRWRWDAARYDPAPARSPGEVGRPRVQGARHPTLAERLVDPKPEWQAVPVGWYGGGRRAREVATGTAVW
jgi:hypothetical protein